MSKLKVSAIHDPDNDNEALTIDSSGNVTASQGFVPSTQLSHRNIIINGAMRVAQRGTSKTGVTGVEFNTVDRFRSSFVSLGTWTLEKSTDAPDEFSNSIKCTCTTADASPASGDLAGISYFIEGQDLQGLAYGSANAKTTTLSFWVKSNKTGNATVNLYQKDNSNKQISPSYTINTADTWEYKTISIPADTSGVIDNDNGTGFEISWWINSGSTFSSGTNQTNWTAYSSTDSNASNLGVGGATSDYFAITGVQLEVGSVATPFEHRSYGEELARCERYYEIIDTPLAVTTNFYNTTTATANFSFKTTKRANPTITLPSSKILYVNNGSVTVSSYSGVYIRKDNFFIQINGSGYVGGYCGQLDLNGEITMDAEL